MDLPGWRKGLRAETSDDTNELVFPPVHRQRMGMPFVGRAPPSDPIAWMSWTRLCNLRLKNAPARSESQDTFGSGIGMDLRLCPAGVNTLWISFFCPESLPIQILTIVSL
jgi:hypothetical protein